MDANNNHNGKVNDFPEAPASWNTRYVDPNGFECQITLRGDSGSELLEKANYAISYLLKNGCNPYVFYRNGNRQADSKSESDKNDDTQNKGTNGTNGSNGTNSNPAWCSRIPGYSMTLSKPISPMVLTMRLMRRSSRQRRPPTRTTSYAPCHRATTPCSTRRQATSHRGRSSCSQLPAPSWSTHRS
jgi:hypothetical protein